MTKDIAVLVGKNGETTSLYNKGKIVIYRKKQGSWNVLKEKDFALNEDLDMKDLRKKMAEAIEFLNGCKIIVGRSITGIPYFELEKCLFSIWEFQGKPEEILDHVLEKEEEQEADRDKKDIQLSPVEISAGCYRISIKEIQESDTGVTTKQVLLPFLREAVFHSLEVRCNHVPPWLETEFAAGNIFGEIEKISNNEAKIIITRRCCN
jgi:Fe-only nitrogenase accessory protein AnfO